MGGHCTQWGGGGTSLNFRWGSSMCWKNGSNGIWGFDRGKQFLTEANRVFLQKERINKIELGMKKGPNGIGKCQKWVSIEQKFPTIFKYWSAPPPPQPGRCASGKSFVLVVVSWPRLLNIFLQSECNSKHYWSNKWMSEFWVLSSVP